MVEVTRNPNSTRSILSINAIVNDNCEVNRVCSKRRVCRANTPHKLEILHNLCARNFTIRQLLLVLLCYLSRNETNGSCKVSRAVPRTHLGLKKTYMCRDNSTARVLPLEYCLSTVPFCWYPGSHSYQANKIILPSNSVHDTITNHSHVGLLDTRLKVYLDFGF